MELTLEDTTYADASAIRRSHVVMRAVSYDGTAQPSKLTVAALVVSEGVVGLLFLAAALPMGARWWKRRRPPLSR